MQPMYYERLRLSGVVPNGKEPRHDIIQAVTFRNSLKVLIAFCQGIQAAAPVDSYVTPEPWDMPGYDSARLSWQPVPLSRVLLLSCRADGPLKPPYAVYFQGGLTWEHAKLGVMMSLQKLVDAKLVSLN